MPLWRSMQVWPVLTASSIFSRARAVCLWNAIDSQEWQLRRSRESFAFIVAQTRVAIALRSASNVSGVSILPVK